MRTFAIGAAALCPVAAVAAGPACTAAEHRQFDFWVGEWVVRWHDAEAGREVEGRNRIRRAHDGCAIVEEFDGRPGTPLTGSSLSIYVAAEKRWRQTWVDNAGSHLDFEGGWRDGRMVLERAAPERGPAARQRMVFKDIAADSLTWDWEMSSDGGATWSLRWRLTYRRQR